MLRSVLAWLDRVLYRRPFEGRTARRYASAERPGFGDLDDRLLDAMGTALANATRLLADLARDAGWQLRSRHDDPQQPVYILELE